MTRRTWTNLGAMAPTALTDARLVLHHAVQIPSAAGTTLLPDRDDFVHTNLTWVAALDALAGHSVPEEGGVRAALRLPDLSLLVLDPHDQVLDTHSLAGETQEGALRWLADQLTGEGAPSITLEPPEHELPEHPVAQGRAFSQPDEGASAELARWFANADLVLRTFASGEARAEPVYCWPHHFDLATLVVLDPDVEGEEARSVGVGLSPGDASYDQPYWYVTPWPYPEDRDDLPELPAGHWHTEGFVAAVLTGEQTVEADDQQALVERFLRGAFEACLDLLE